MIALNPHLLALVTRLETVTFGTPPVSLKVGDGVAPKSSDSKIVAPCVVLHARDGGSLESSIGCLDTDGTMPFQTTSVGRTASEARAVDDKVGAALVATFLQVTGRWCRVRPQTASANAERDDTVTPPLYYVTTIYRLLTLSA